MDPRYSSQPITDIFSREATLRRWMDVEIATLSAQVSLELIPPDSDAFSALSRVSFTPDVLTALDIAESNLHHDVAAFVRVVPRLTPSGKCDWAERYFHFGLTSSDVVDTALSISIQDATSALLTSLVPLQDCLTPLPDLPYTVGRTHGQPARSMQWGHRMQGWLYAATRSAQAVYDASDHLKVGRLRGPLGDFSPYITPRVEALALRELHLRAVRHATQVIPRDLHADLIYALARFISTLDKIATDLRLLSIPELNELSPTPPKGYQGSSSMPHKVNPTSLERISGLARLARSYVAPALEDISLWLERDISHSSVERVIIPDMYHLAMQCVSDLLSFFQTSFHPTGRFHTGPDSYEELHQAVLAGESRQTAHRHLSGR